MGPCGRGCGLCVPAVAGHVSLRVPACAWRPPGRMGAGILAQGAAAPGLRLPEGHSVVRMGVTTHTFMPVSVLVKGGGDWQKSKSRGVEGRGGAGVPPPPMPGDPAGALTSEPSFLGACRGLSAKEGWVVGRDGDRAGQVLC